MYSVSTDLRTRNGQPLPHAVALPELQNDEPWSPTLDDRIGTVVYNKGLFGALPPAACSLIGAALLGRATHSVRAGLVGGALGAIAGAATSIGLWGGTRSDPNQGTGQAASTAPSASEDIKVMTYNLHGGMGGVNQYGSDSDKLDKLAEVVQREQPDILLVQELDDNAFRSSRVDGFDELSKRLNPTSAVAGAPVTRVSGSREECGVFTFNGYTIQDARNLIAHDPSGDGVVRRALGFLGDRARSVLGEDERVIPTRSYTPRNDIDVMVRTPDGNDVRVDTAHLNGNTDSDHDHQRAEIDPLAAELGSWSGPTILGADFNISSFNDGDISYERGHLGDAGLHDTFDDEGVDLGAAQRVSTPTGEPIDRIYVSGHFQASDTRTVAEHDLGYTMASDHDAVVTTLHLNSPGS